MLNDDKRKANSRNSAFQTSVSGTHVHNDCWQQKEFNTRTLALDGAEKGPECE
jgi:hypothetical protein